MSLSNDDLPGNFVPNNIPAYSPSGTRLSNRLFDKDRLIRFKRVSFVSQTGAQVIQYAGDELYLDVNPRNLTITKTKAINTNNYTRAGYVPQYWGEELDVLSIQGTSAAFISNTKGLTRQDAKDTAGYKNFMNLLFLYKNNGAQFQNKGPRQDGNQETFQTLANIKTSFRKRENQQAADSQITSTQRKVIDKRYLIEMKYFDLLCYGNFESFTFSESV